MTEPPSHRDDSHEAGAPGSSGDLDEGAELASFRHMHEAELAQGFLDDAGIPAAVLGDVAGEIQYGKKFSQAARLLVRRRDLEEAREVLRDAGILEQEPDTEA